MNANRLFSDNMVLQRDIPVPVWGTAAPGERVTVEFAGQTKTAAADSQGRWRIHLDPLLASSEPRSLKISGSTGNHQSKITNVLVGEVWICSGQSNMEMNVSSSTDRDTEIAAAHHPNLRMFTVSKKAVLEPQSDPVGSWAVCSPDTVGAFSAVGYFFSRELHRRLEGIPVGMINTSWGGTLAEAWTRRESLLAVPALRGLVEQSDRLRNDPQARLEYGKKYAVWEKTVQQDAGDTGWARGWAAPEAPLDGWVPFPVPGTWQSKGKDFSGIFWFRREVDVPAAWAGKELQLSLGACDKSDITWFNNVQVGSITMEQRPDAWSTPRQYTIPGRLVKAGPNVVAVRIFSNIYGGGFIGHPSEMFLAPAGAVNGSRLMLAGDWQHRVEANFGKVAGPPPGAPLTDDSPHVPASLYHGMIAPLVPYAIRGAIWYQGESNADRAHQYCTLFPTMIRDWRRAWGQGEFSFLFAQLANYMPVKPEPGDSAWAELREAQRLTLREPNTGMAVAIDIGDAVDIHPKNKQDVGRRLAYPALAQVYGQRLPWSGPALSRWEAVEGCVRLSFDHAEGGLVTTDGGPVLGFTIAGPDREFRRAWARIEGDTVVVRHPQVPNPMAVRYAWADNPVCNLANRAGLPASPSRTDDWPWTTAKSG